MTITATIAGAISMLAQFGLFFGGGARDNNSGPRRDRNAGHDDSRPHRGHDRADGDQPHARIRRRRSRRPHQRPPDALASALARISNAAPAIENPSAERAPATAHLFIINPLTHRGMDNLFSTHPSTENRIAALQRLSGWRKHADIGEAGTRRFRARRSSVPSYPARPRGPWGTDGFARSVGVMPADPAGLAVRRLAADILDNVLRRRRPLDEQLQNKLQEHETLSERDRALVRALMATVLRRLGTLRHLLRGFLDRGLPAAAPRVETALLIGAAQILWLDVPDHAAVDLAVRLVQADRAPPAMPVSSTRCCAA